MNNLKTLQKQKFLKCQKRLRENNKESFKNFCKGVHFGKIAGPQIRTLSRNKLNHKHISIHLSTF